MADLGFGLIGCGRISDRHGDLLVQGQILGARLIAVCDTNFERAKKAGEKFKVPYYDSVHKMMEAHGDHIGVLSILTPSGLHAPVCLEIVRYQKHIVVEKPMALTLTDADAMIKACDAHGVRLFVVKQNRYNRPIVKLQEAMERGRFGKLVMGTVRVRWCRTQSYYDLDKWRGTWALDGGVFANQASHHVDVLEWMMGDVESVFAKGITALVDIETEDTGVAILKFTSGALGIIEATTATRPKDTEGSVSILGENGMVEVGGFALNEMKTWNFKDSRPEDKDILPHYKENPPNVYGFGHQQYLNHVVECLKNEKAALVDGLEGRKSLELIAAIYESIETGREVKLGFKQGQSRLGKVKA